MILQLVILFVLIYLYKYKYINENILVSTIFIYLCLVIHYKQNEPFYFGFVNEPPENKPSDQSTKFNFQYNYAGIALNHPLKINNKGELVNTFNDNDNSNKLINLDITNEYLSNSQFITELKERNYKDVEDLIISNCSDFITDNYVPTKLKSKSSVHKSNSTDFHLTKYENSSGISSMIVMPGFQVTARIIEETNNIDKFTININGTNTDIYIPYIIKYKPTESKSMYAKIYHLVFDTNKIIKEPRKFSPLENIKNSESMADFYKLATNKIVNLEDLRKLIQAQEDVKNKTICYVKKRLY